MVRAIRQRLDDEAVESYRPSPSHQTSDSIIAGLTCSCWCRLVHPKLAVPVTVGGQAKSGDDLLQTAAMSP